MRILHLPTSIGNNAWALSRGERALGVHSDTLVTNTSFLDYPADSIVDLSGSSTALGRWYRLLKAFLSVRARYDVFHFNWGSSLFTMRGINLQHLELPFYPDTAALFATYNGCDARQKFPTLAKGGVSACGHCGVGDCGPALDRSREAGVIKMERYAQHLWALNPDLLPFLPRQRSGFLPYAVPIVEKARPQRDEGRRRLRVAHAPTNREIKGTAFLLSAVDAINRRHPDAIELVLVEGKSHAEALEIYGAADVIVDQLLIGWYGAFAVETMMQGKPVIVRIDARDAHAVPGPMREELLQAVIQADPNTIEEVLEGLLDSPAKLAGHAEACFEYARRWHDPVHVASLTVAKYEEALRAI